MHDLQIPSEFRSNLVHKLYNALHIQSRVIIGAFRCIFRLYQHLSAVKVTTIEPHVTTNISISLFHITINTFSDFFPVFSVGMPVQGNSFSAFSPEQIIDRHSRQFALDVPQCLIYSGHSVVQYRTVSPIGTAHHRLPDFLDVLYIFFHKQRLQILLHCGYHRFVSPRKGGTAVAVQLRLRCFYLHNHQVDPPGGGDKSFHISDYNFTHKIPPSVSFRYEMIPFISFDAKYRPASV